MQNSFAETPNHPTPRVVRVPEQQAAQAGAGLSPSEGDPGTVEQQVGSIHFEEWDFPWFSSQIRMDLRVQSRSGQWFRDFVSLLGFPGERNLINLKN